MQKLFEAEYKPNSYSKDVRTVSVVATSLTKANEVVSRHLRRNYYSSAEIICIVKKADNILLAR